VFREDQNVLLDVNKGNAGWWFFDFNDSNLNNIVSMVFVDVYVTTNYSTRVFHTSYYVKHVGQVDPDLVYDLQMVGADLGPIGSNLFMIVILLGILIAAVSYVPFDWNAPSLFGLASIVLFVFVYVGWLDFIIWAFIVAFGTFGYILIKGRS